eukprot:TRINITY_DN44468_c0_g1_i1.p1 TRINITY_DN44468_c0_g1~~TRINITY_DN44468_c0_g1_i1.p1  ORF type:complete len:207 (-),score=40.06 TRINITY_DN44468_c0_g1_i1:96-716(-)
MESINRALRLNAHRSSATAARLTLPASALPDWVEVGHRLCYISRTNKNVTHYVKVSKIEERKQTVLVVFEMDKRVWKRVPFAEISKAGDGSLRPLWKPEPSVASCPSRPAQFVAGEDDVQVTSVAMAGKQVQGPLGEDDSRGSTAEVMSTSGEPQMAVGDSEDERQEQMERRMRRMQRTNAEKARSRSRSPKKKSLCYVPGHCEMR